MTLADTTPAAADIEVLIALNLLLAGGRSRPHIEAALGETREET